MGAEIFVEEKAKEFLGLYKNLTSVYWNATLTGEENKYNEVAEREIALKKFFNDKENFGKAKEFLRDEKDEVLKRQLKLLYDAYLSNQGSLDLLSEVSKKSSEVERKFNVFRADVDGKKVSDNEIKKILRDELDSGKLERAWCGFKKVGEIVGDDVLEIVRLRNKLARSLGFENYYEFSLDVSEQKESEIFEIFDELDSLIAKPFEDLKNEIDLNLAKKFGIEVKSLKPWHYGDLFFQEAPKIYSVDLDDFYKDDILEKARRYYESLGLSVDDILKRSSLFEAKGKYQHAYCMDMDRGGDVRTMQNLKNDENGMSTLLHELGHGVYWKYMSSDLPIVLRDTAHTFVTEAVAMIFGRKASNLDFVKKVCGEDFDDGGIIKKILRLEQIVFSRWTQVMFRFERELYKNPEQNLNKVWWDLVRKYQLIDFYRDKPDWASKIHIVSSPVYYHNYMLGELLASQLHSYIMENFSVDGDSYFGSREVGDFFKEKIFRVGARYRWDELIRRATGENLSARFFVREFVG